MSALHTSDLLQVFKTRRKHCRALLELSRRQRKVIAADDYTQLLALLSQKQRVLGRLEELNKQHPGLRQQWQNHRGSLEPNVREECDHVLAETETLLADLLNEEKDSTNHLVERRDATQRQLQAISNGTQVHNAYRDSLAPATHRHLDVGQ